VRKGLITLPISEVSHYSGGGVRRAPIGDQSPSVR